jgi:hypothetical protein
VVDPDWQWGSSRKHLDERLEGSAEGALRSPRSRPREWFSYCGVRSGSGHCWCGWAIHSRSCSFGHIGNVRTTLVTRLALHGGPHFSALPRSEVPFAPAERSAAAVGTPRVRPRVLIWEHEVAHGEAPPVGARAGGCVFALAALLDTSMSSRTVHVRYGDGGV